MNNIQNPIYIRALNQSDWLDWRTLRLEALRTTPEAYGSSFEEESAWSAWEFQACIRRNTLFGAFFHDTLVGGAGFFIHSPLKTRHKGVMWGVYVQPAYRQQGLAGRLIETVIAHAKNCLEQLHLTCVTTNHIAFSLYQKYGFQLYGTEPNAIKVGDIYYDEYLMALNFGLLPKN